MICEREGCGLPTAESFQWQGRRVPLCDCCSEVLTNWLKGHGEFHHGSWERKILNENTQLLQKIDRLEGRRPTRTLVRRLLGGD